MARRRKKDIASDMAEYEKKLSQSDLNSLNSIDRLVSCCLIPDGRQRKKAVAEVLAQNSELRKLLNENSKLLVSQVERSLVKQATGYTVTETTKRISGGRVFTETKTKQVPPNQKAIEYFLNNRAADKWSGSPNGEDDGALAKLDEILKGVKANAADSETK